MIVCNALDDLYLSNTSQFELYLVMNLKKLFISLVAILMIVQFLTAQTVESIFRGIPLLESSILIDKADEKILVSGILPNENVKKELLDIVTDYFGPDINFANLKTDSNAKDFGIDWKTKLRQLLNKSKSVKKGLIKFGTDKSDLPNVPVSVMNAEILLIDGKTTIKLSELGNQLIIFSFIEAWAGPAQETAEVLSDISQVQSGKIMIIAVSGSDGKEDQADFRKFMNTFHPKIHAGFIDIEVAKELFNLSGLQGVPQTFVIKNGKFLGIFVGGGMVVNQKLHNFVTKSLES